MSTSIARRIIPIWESLTIRLRATGEFIPRLIMRLIMGWEFWESGLEKYRGQNWFADISTQFPFPFNIVPTQISWSIATWFELIGAVMLWIGLGTRFFAFSLLVLTFVATAAVHWPDMYSMWTDLLKGYAVTDHGFGNFKLPLLFSVMLIPLIFNGAGKFSLDQLIANKVGLDTSVKQSTDATAWALAALVLAIPFLFLVPKIGFVLIGIALSLLAFRKFVQ
jgi:putative oxidoreductase